MPKAKEPTVVKRKYVRKKVVKLPELKDCIIDAIKDKKGENIVLINFEKIENAFCDYFIVCQGSSNRQVEAIADSIQEKVKKVLNIKASHVEGYQNAEWVLLDYFDIIVHVFQPETRNFFQLESLWADAETLNIAEN